MNNISKDKGKLWSKDYILLTVSNFFLFFGDILLLPVLPVYVKQNGVTDFQVGIVVAVFFAPRYSCECSRPEHRRGLEKGHFAAVSILFCSVYAGLLFVRYFNSDYSYQDDSGFKLWCFIDTI